MNVTSPERRLKYGLQIFLLVILCMAGSRARSAQINGQSPQAGEELRLLVEQLGSDVFAEREAAQRRVERLGTQGVESLCRLQLEITDPETRWRLAQAIRANSRPRWFTGVDAASRAAKREGKLLMVFSTIGEIDGFS